MKTTSLFTALLLSARFSLSTAAVTPRANEYTMIQLYSSSNLKDKFLDDRWYPKEKYTGCIILADKLVPEMHKNKMQAFRCNNGICYQREYE
ncbi:Protein of unknown function [Pyronema omphalodes CBS 100304]|uniref:Secreted protein n=1 Tax=Pyronema omphalodes (strain CBS 100304) TaxID=1076935 RepID=U4LM72_PYROM|nr:Protein of unknown function [Pyronema omphalodes CBS 100304]